MRVYLRLDIDRHGAPLDKALEVLLQNIGDFMVHDGTIITIDEKFVEQVHVKNARKNNQHPV